MTPFRPPSLQSATPNLILASGSAARLALLQAAGVAVVAQATGVDEAAAKRAAQARGLDPDATALLLAGLKARQIADPDALVIGCDQMLVCEGRWFDKPPDLRGASEHLRALRGRAHVLHTAAVVLKRGEIVWSHVARPCLRMRPFSDSFVDAYIAAEGTQILACVGAYRLEALGVQLFESIEGEHAAILGLPLLELLAFLRHRGVLMA